MVQEVAIARQSHSITFVAKPPGIGWLFFSMKSEWHLQAITAEQTHIFEKIEGTASWLLAEFIHNTAAQAHQTLFYSLKSALHVAGA